MTTTAALDATSIATEALSVLGQGRQIVPFSSRDPSFGLEEAYKVTPIVRQMREARGERVLGRKIGFTNSTIWAQYNVDGPIWGYMYDRTVRNLADIGGVASLTKLTDPRIEPEIVFGLSAAPDAAMDERELLSCIDWLALGYEVVQSIYPDWKFAASDTVAAFGLHGAMLIGERHRISGDSAAWLDQLSNFDVELGCNGEVVDRGHARNVLGGPLSALRHFVGVLAKDDLNPGLTAGEMVTTGTLTRALPVKPGETWTTTVSGIPLGSISVRFS
ncbi:2-keto-4-pentenoate hydratase [Afipia birgiae]|jgi:2-oxo-3-hexenedioate decarboxylase|uniref:2-keto-4-pentenoate hydratase n=1 Tax=Afipia birgiae TaxID=151414 RepID=UPI0002D9E638|nr:fumarylacetoacetate hydrolase family protein [Afipia birgiae]MBX9819159.1 fumarylacetoacetate hydrolase family protein [Afipia birgiae]